jgi:LuxR family transcriptional regulator, maltose regulon positive regulatory protein
MPKAAAYRLIWSRERGVYELSESQSEQALSFSPGSDVWFAWLATIPSFTFRGQHGQLTVRQERMQRGGTYWYAYHRDGDKMRKRYLGRTSELTLARLEEVAAQLSAPRTSPGSLARAHSDDVLFTRLHPRSVVPFMSDAVDTSSVSPDLAGGWHSPQFVTKVHVPRLRAQLVRRAHLIERLQQGMDAALILVSAPAGFGKTTMLAQWLAESGTPVAWLSLEPEDNEPTRFLSAVIAAFQSLDPQIGTSVLRLARPAPPASPPAPEVVLTELAADLFQRLSRNVTFVFDDYHVITAEPIQRALTAFVEHLPPHLHLVIATRADPPLPLARLRARGQLCEVRATHLQFQTEETSDFFHSVMGLPLSAEAIAQLSSRTEGWIAGLQLAALSLQGRADVTQFLEEFTGSHRHIVDYLTEEVLARQTEAIQSFLLSTCILDRFTGPLCDAVTGRTDGEMMLASLEQANLFLVPLDERREWYRYHHLFADMLRARLRRVVGPEGLAALYTRASRWYEHNDAPFEAVEAALKARDFARAEALIEPLGPSMAINQHHTILQHWLERLPRERLFARASFCFAYAYCLFFSAPQEAYAGPLATAEWLFQEQGDHKGMGQAAMLRALAALRHHWDGRNAITFSTQALQVLPEDALSERSASMNSLAQGYQLCGEVAAAQQVLSEARPLHERSGNWPAMLIDAMVLGDLLLMQGKLNQAADTFVSTREATAEQQRFTIRPLLGLSRIAYERNELEAAEDYLEQAATLAYKMGEQLLEARVALMRARVVLARGDAERTALAFRQAHTLAEQCGSISLAEQIRAYQVRSWLLLGRLEVATQWQDECSLSPDTAPTYEREAVALTLVRVLLARGEAEEALRLLERWHTHARTQGRTGSEMEMFVLEALASQQQGKTEQAVQRLEPALVLGYPEGYVRLFVEEGVAMAPLLRLAHARWKSQPEVRYLHALLAALEAAHPGQLSPSQAVQPVEPPLEPFSRRERQVLRLLAAGLSNAEIAEELVVSINTVRTHTRSLYHKLQVNNRKEALAAARHWKLL